MVIIKTSTDSEVLVHHEMSRVIVEQGRLIFTFTQDQAIEFANAILDEAGHITEDY